MKSIGLLLTFSMLVSASCVNAQDQPAKNPENNVVVEGKHASITQQKQKLLELQKKLAQANAQVAARAEQLQALEQALVAQKKQAEVALKQAALANQQAQTQRKRAEESLVRVDQAMAEAQQAKQSQEIGQYKALLHLAERKQGPEHAYSQAVRTQLNSLEVELAQMSKVLGPSHPKVAQTKQKIEAVQSQLKKMTPEALNISKEVAILKERTASNRSEIQKRIETARAKAINRPETAEKLQSQVAELFETWQRANIGTRLELAAKENAELLQRRRTQELLEMQNRLLSAQNVAKNPVVRGYYKPANTDERFKRLELKLDKIASLLEKLVDAKE